MRVIHVVPPAFGYTFSGPARHTLRLIQEWPVPEINVSLWGSSYLQHSQSKTDLWTKNVRHTRRIRLIWSLRLLWMLIRYRRTYDLVHMHALWWGGLLVPLLARLLGKRTIYHMTLLGSDTPKGLVMQSLGKVKLALFRRYHGLIALTPAMLEDCKEYRVQSNFALLPEYLVFDPPVPSYEYRRKIARQQLGIPEKAQVLLFVGSMISRKGVDLLVDIYTRLASQQPDLWLLLVGAHAHDENPRLDEDFVVIQREKLEQKGLNERVIWTGLVRDETDLIATYLASDIFVFPTRAEGQGNVILEAMGCGLPVVCSHLPRVTDVMVVPNETGYLVDVDDLDGFIAATIRLLDDPALRGKMGEAGRKRATTDFGFEAYCHKLADFYRQVAEAKSP